MREFNTIPLWSIYEVTIQEIFTKENMTEGSIRIPEINQANLQTCSLEEVQVET